MENYIIDKVLFELDNIMCEDRALSAHTRAEDGALIPGRRYRSPLGVSWYVRPCNPEGDAWQVVLCPPVPSRWSKKVALVETEERTSTRIITRLLRAMCRLAEEAAAEA